MSYKTLYILRHAKAVPLSGDLDDHDRPLSERGEADARKIGAYMLQRNMVPQLVICSTAVRTRQTLHEIENIMDRPLRTHFSAKLYLASPKEVIEELMGVPDNLSNVLVVGHNPTVHQLVADLVESGEEGLLSTLARGFPTAMLAEIQYSVTEWNEFGPRRGVLKQLISPAELVSAS